MNSKICLENPQIPMIRYLTSQADQTMTRKTYYSASKQGPSRSQVDCSVILAQIYSQYVGKGALIGREIHSLGTHTVCLSAHKAKLGHQ